MSDQEDFEAFKESKRREHGQGDHPLDAVETFLARFVIYPSEAARIAHVLWIAHTHSMDRWESTPRIAFLSEEPASGKSRALEVTEPLVPRAVHAVNVTPAYLFRKVADDAGPPTILYDEADTVFGPRAKDNEDIRGFINAGHRTGATAGRVAVKGKTYVPEELPAYCAIALAGLRDLPDTVMSRSIIVRMQRRAPNERVEPWRHRVNSHEGEELGDWLAVWAQENADKLEWPAFPAEVEDRGADVWESLLMVADLAGGEWPIRARRAAVALVAVSWGEAESLGVRLLTDLHAIFGTEERMLTSVVLTRLLAIEESPWADLRGKPLDSRSLAKRLRPFGVTPQQHNYGPRTLRGYEAADLADPWVRYVAGVVNSPKESLGREERVSDGNAASDSSRGTATSATAATPVTEPPSWVTDDEPEPEPEGVPSSRSCRVCGKPTGAPGNVLCDSCSETRIAQVYEDIVTEHDTTTEGAPR